MLVLPTEIATHQTVAVRAAEIAACGRGVLIGTRMVAGSEALSQFLTQAGRAHPILNARQDADEAAVIA